MPIDDKFRLKNESRPIHQTEEFRATVRKIKEKQNAVPTAATPVVPEKKAPEFNIPLPGIQAPKGRGGIPTDVYKRQQAALQDQVRKDVLYDLAKQLPKGTKISDLKDFDLQGYIDYHTNIRLEAKKNPSSAGDFTTARHATRIANQEKKAQISQIRTDVLNEYQNMPTSRPDIKAFIEKKVQERVDKLIHQQPRYVFLEDGRPFYFDDHDERADLERSLIGETPLRRKWTLAKYDLANVIGNVVQKINDPALRVKEILTDTDEGNAFGALIQLGFNSSLLGVEYIRAGAYELFVTESRWKRLEQEAEAIKYTDPQKAAGIMQSAQHWKKQWELKQNLNDRLGVAEQAVKASWERLQQGYEYNKENVPYIGSGSGPMRQLYFEQQIKKEEAAKQEASALRARAVEAYNTGDYETAISTIKDAQEKDRDASNHDVYGAYTWIREPERYEKLKEDAALLELQKGEPLSEGEIRRLKEYHSNSWTELTGEFIFDPLNIIPAAMLDDALRLSGKGLKAAGQVPGIKQTVDVLGSPIRWLRRETVTSGANRVSLKTHDLFERVSNAYLKADDSVKAIDEIGSAVMLARGAPNEQAARAIFDQARQKIPGLQNISFRDFKQLMDAGEHLDPGEWGKIYQDALVKAEDDLLAVAAQRGVDPSEVMSEFSKSRRALMEVSTKFHGAYVDPHRIYKGASFTDDTIAGWAVKTMRELSGEQVADTLKLNGLDEWAIKIGQTIDPRTRSALGAATKAVESLFYVGGFLRDVWATTVLSTPRWIMSNLPDTAMRSAVHGGNLFDDLGTLFSSTQRTLADELGVVPLAFSQALSRADLDFAENVTSRLLYENWKPKSGFGGLFSYWAYEYKRLFKGDAALAKRAIMDDMLSGIPESKLKHAMTWLGDGLYVKTPLFLKSWSGAISDFNTAIEFTFRLRMFHREYFKLLEKLEPKFMAKGLEGLSPASKDLATQIWKAAEGNPRRLAAYTEALTGTNVKGTPAQWSLIVPPEIEQVTKGMDAVDRQLFISGVRSSLEDFIQKSTKAGKELKGEDFGKFFDDYVDKFRDELQARMSQSHGFKDVDTTIRKDGKANDPVDMDDLKGSAPVPPDQAPRNIAIEKATSNIKKGSRRSTEDIAKDFEIAVSEYAAVTRVPGDGITRTVVNGKTVIEIGEDVLKKGQTRFFKQLHEAVIDVFRNTDSDYVTRSGFKSLDDYEETFRRFVDDPTAILKEDERKFLTIANELDAHPRLRELIERTRDKVDGKINKIKYDSMLDFYRDIGVYSDGYGFTKPPEQIFEAKAQEIRRQPGYHVAAAQESARTTAELARIEKTLPPELGERITDFRERWSVYREELKQFYAFTYPGPLMKSIHDAERHKGWELFYKMSADEFVRETELKKRLIDAIQNNPAEAERIMNESLDDFGTYFLKQNGIELEWDADMQRIMNIKMTVDGRVRNFKDNLDLAHLQRRLFTKDINQKLADAPFIRLRKDARAKLHNQLRNALRDTFDLPTAHAEAWAKVIDSHAAKWAKETGQDVSGYYERLGFQRVEDGRGLLTREGTRVVKRGAVARQEGGFIFYGLSQSNFEAMVRETGELFFDDLVSMAEHSAQSADDLKALKSYIESQTPGKPIRANRLDQEQSNILADLFTGYIHSGQGPDIKIKGGLEKFKGWLSSTFDAVKNTPVADEMNDDVYRVMDRLFIEQKINDVPKTSKRKIKIIAKEMGIKFESDDDLLQFINEAVAPGSTAPDLSKLTPELQAQRDALEGSWRLAEEEYRALVDEAAGFAGDSTMSNAMMGNDPRIMQAEEKMNAASKAIQDFDDTLPKRGSVPITTRQVDMSKEEVTALSEEFKSWPTDAKYEADAAIRVPDKESHTGEQLLIVKRDAEGKVTSVARFSEEGDNIHIFALASRESGRSYGTEIMRDIERIAAERGKGVHLMSLGGSKEFYKKIGMTETSTNMFLKSADEIKAANAPAPAFKSLDEVPNDVIIKTLGNGKESQISKELQEGWETWRTTRALVGFPDEALESPDVFKAYLTDRIGKEWGEASNYYNRLMWEVEQFENAMLNHHAGDDFAELLFPRVPEAQISDGVRTFIRNQEGMMTNYEASLKALDEWKKFLVKTADEGHPSWVMPKEQKKELLEWSKRASNDKAEMMDTILNGADDMEGAIDKVNRVMINYQHSNLFDNFMKNFFPFWKFPSRSFPFWAETMVTHPQIIANYEKIQRLSRSHRYQSGAITSKGKPMPSLDGYIKIPGTDMWFNPLAPLSFRYLLDIAKTKDDVLYAANTAEEEVEPKAFMVKELMQTGQIYGFSLAPWMAFLMKEAYQIPDEVLPRYPLAPQIPLIPRWMVYDLIQKANKITIPGGGEIRNLGDAIYPEVPWHDYLVERQILEQTLSQIQTGNLTDKQKNELITKASEAIKQKGDNPLWQESYKNLSQEEWVHNMSSFFTGFHPKEFSDMQANMLALRNERNQLKSALNNEFQATIFDIPTDADAGWDKYLKALDAPDGWVYRLYTDIGWVRDEQGKLTRDPKERAKYLALKIEQDEDLQTYYDEMSDLQNWYNDTLRGLPVGANWEQTQAIYEKYAEKKAALQHLRSFETFYGTNKPKALIEREITNDWFRAVNATRPRWEITKGETYEQYQARTAEWQMNLPKLAPILMRTFSRGHELNKTLGALHPDQKLRPDFFTGLVTATSIEGLENWEKGNDDVFDALNKAWKATYWDSYWNGVIGKTGYDVDLAENDFFAKHPDAPDAQGLYTWIQQYYGSERFTFDEVKQWVEDSDALTVEQRQLSEQADPQDYQKRQDIWNMLSWLGPGNRNRGVFDQAFLNAGGDPDQLTVWYEEAGNAYASQPEKLNQLHDNISAAIKTLELKAPSRPELVRFIQAQDENDTFKQLVSDELGNRFFDWKDANDTTQPGLFSFYNGLDREGRTKFRDEHGDEYDIIQSYYDMRAAFGEEHQAWNDYYGLETTPTAKVPEDGLSLTPPSPRGPKFGGGGGRSRSGQSKPAAYPPSTTTYRSDGNVPNFYIPDRTGINLSPGLYNLVGTKMNWEITQMFASGRRISSSGVSFLRSVASRYPQYRQEITQILAKGS
jgi:hypothetical protein